MRPNRLRQLLDAGKPSVGTRMVAPWPGMLEIIGHTGAFDYVEYLGEYSPFSLDLLDNLGRAADLFANMSSMIKVEEQTRGFIATHAIDSGIQNVLFTDCRSAADVRECVRLVRSELPELGGSHGAGMRRAVGYVLEGGTKTWCQAMSEVVIAIMIEKKGAMDELEEILAVKGVDMVQFGGTDYSISIGQPGQARSQLVQQTQQRMIEMALKAGVQPRVELHSIDEARPWLDLGVRHFSVGTDISVLYNWWKHQGTGMRELLASI